MCVSVGGGGQASLTGPQNIQNQLFTNNLNKASSSNIIVKEKYITDQDKVKAFETNKVK
jgi:hypothetical protein